MKVGDKVRIHPKVYDNFKGDSITQVSKDTIYEITKIYEDSLYLKPVSGEGIGKDGLPYDDTPRGILDIWWIDKDINKSFIPIGQEQKSFTNAPRNNDGRTTCFWCNVSTEKRGGGMYDVCPKCGQ